VKAEEEKGKYRGSCKSDEAVSQNKSQLSFNITNLHCSNLL